MYTTNAFECGHATDCGTQPRHLTSSTITSRESRCRSFCQLTQSNPPVKIFVFFRHFMKWSRPFMSPPRGAVHFKWSGPAVCTMRVPTNSNVLDSVLALSIALCDPAFYTTSNLLTFLERCRCSNTGGFPRSFVCNDHVYQSRSRVIFTDPVCLPDVMSAHHKPYVVKNRTNLLYTPQNFTRFTI